jgi:hypothetical protein
MPLSLKEMQRDRKKEENMDYYKRKQKRIAAELFVALLVIVLTLAWSQTAFGQQKSITLPKGTKVQKIGQGHFKFKLPNGQVVEVKGLVNSGGGSSTIGESGIYGPAGKLIASGRQGNLTPAKKITKETAARLPQTDYVMIDGEPALLPATIIFQPAGIKDYGQSSRLPQETTPLKSMTALPNKSQDDISKPRDISKATINMEEVLRNQLKECEQGTQELVEQNNTLQKEINTLQQQKAELQQKLNAATQVGGSAVKAYCESPTVSRNTSGAKNDCALTGYMCEPVSGLCRTSCRKTQDYCAPGYACDTMQGPGVCVNWNQ